MRYLDPERLLALDEQAFRSARPYPFVNPAGLLHDEAFEALRDNLPPAEWFETSFGKARKHGQRSHDRFQLKWREGLELPAPWQGFIDELRGSEYREFLARMIGNDAFEVGFNWHYTPAGCEVSPHCDAAWKLGSHIFYLNSEADWDPAWGGETVILDDGGRFSPRSAPEFQDFHRAVGSESVGNYSLLFIRNGNSWHGVRRIACPEGRLRRVFIVVIRRVPLGRRLRSRLLRPGVAKRHAATSALGG